MQPMNYLSNAQNPMQSYLEGLKFGQDIRATQEALALDEKKKLFQADLLALQAKPTGNGMLNLMMKYPDFAKSLEPIQKAYSSAEKQGELSQLMQIDNALANGNAQLALDLSNTAKKALTNTGESTEQIDTIIKLITNNDTKGAQGTTSALLASVLGDKYKSYAEAKTIDLKRPSEVLESASKAKSSQVQLEIDISTKQAKIDTLRAKALTAISEAEKADIEAKIAEATKDLKILEQENKTKTSGQELIIKTTEANYIEPLKKLEVTKKQLENESEKLDQKLTKAKTQNEYQELKNKKQDFENKIADYNVKINEQTEKVGVAASTASENYRLIDDLMAGGKKLYGDLKGEKGKIIPATGVTSNMLPTLTQKTKEIENQINTFKDKATLIFAPQYAPMFKPMSVDEVNIIKNAASELDPSNSIETNMKILEKAHITLKKAYKNVEKSTGFTKEDANKYSPPSKVKTEKPKNDPFKVF